MSTAGSLLVNVRKLFGDPDGDFITDSSGLDWLNQAQRRFCHKVLALDEYKDYTITANQSRYDLPTDCIIPIQMMWYQQRTEKLEYSPPDKWGMLEMAYSTSNGIPDTYTIIRRQIVLGPSVPSTRSATALVSGALTASASTLGLTAASGTFRSKGWVQIASGTSIEVAEYTGVATTTLTGVTRGVHNTTAASFASNATVTQIDLLMLYRKTPAAISATTASPDIPIPFQDYLEKYVLYLAWQARGDSNKSQMAFQEFLALEADCIKTIGRRSADGLMRIQDKRNRWYARW